MQKLFSLTCELQTPPNIAQTNMQPDWILKRQTAIANYLARHREIPDFLTYYSPQIVADYTNVYLHKIIPSDFNQIIHQEIDLLGRSVDLLSMRLRDFDKINVFDLASTTGDSTLPLILELLQDDRVVKYIPVTANQTLNQHAVRKLLSFTIHAKLSRFQYDSIRCELEYQDCKVQVNDIVSQNEFAGTANLFLLLDSRLGNSLDPRRMLENIYRSLGSGDFLAIVQSIYRQGTEDMIITDFENMLKQKDTFEPTKELGRMLAPNTPLRAKWDDSEVPGLRLSVVTEGDQNFGELKIPDQTEISVFRSSRFHRQTLENLLRQVGFHISDISFDRQDDNALFLVKKL